MIGTIFAIFVLYVLIGNKFFWLFILGVLIAITLRLGWVRYEDGRKQLLTNKLKEELGKQD